MKKFIFVGSALLIVGVVYITGFYRPRYESDHALSLAKARTHLRQQLPPDANQIWVLDEYVGPGHFRYLIRFQAPVASVSAWAEQIKQSQAGWEVQDISENLTQTLSDTPVWFDVHTIQHGLRYTTTGSSAKRIWINKDTGTTYYSESD